MFNHVLYSFVEINGLFYSHNLIFKKNFVKSSYSLIIRLKIDFTEFLQARMNICFFLSSFDKNSVKSQFTEIDCKLISRNIFQEGVSFCFIHSTLLRFGPPSLTIFKMIGNCFYALLQLHCKSFS